MIRTSRMTGSRLAAVLLLALPVGFRPDSAGEAKAAPTPATSTRMDAFASTVRPMLAAKCAPCHEPGGKMYAKLPFDRPQTISGHAPGVLKRLKGADREAVEKWLASLPASK